MPNVIVIDNNHNTGKVCCYAEAARTIGIAKGSTISSWAKKALKENRNREYYRHYEVVFVYIEVVKQNKGDVKRFKS